MRAAWLAVLAACNASPDLGLDSILQVIESEHGAQYRPGPFPDDEGGPASSELRTRRSMFPANELAEPFDATLELSARTAAVGIDGIDGAWLIVAAPPDLDSQSQPTAKATLGISVPGPYELILAAADSDGRFGPRTATTVTALYDFPPAGMLVIGLYWESDADLDLHVIDALGGEAYSDDPNTWEPPPPGTPVPPGDPWLAGGILNHDGNKDCTRDGRPDEHVIWKMPPPAGDYIVRVDAPSLCGEASTAWYVVVYRGEELLGAARGIATQADVNQPRGRGAGVTALHFTLP